MPRFSIYVLCWAVSVFSLGGGAASAASRPSETLLPDATQGFFAISNVDVLNQHWDKCQLGQLVNDPAMKAFKKDVRRQFDEQWKRVHERLGLTFDDMRKTPSGDVAIGLVRTGPGKSALAIVADVAGKLPQARAMLEKTTKTQSERGATRSEVTVPGCADTVIQFDLPELPEEKEAARKSEEAARQNQEANGKEGEGATQAPPPSPPPPRQAFYCLTGNLLAVTEDLDVMKGILDRYCGNHQNGSLAEFRPFRVVIDRCKKDYGEEAPQMRWFLQPVGYAEAARASTPEYKRRKGKTVLEVMRRQGLPAVLGIGGLVDFSSEGCELIHRTAIFAPPPYAKSMKMALFLNSPDFTPQPWVPSDISTYATFYTNMLNAFDNYGPFYDEFIGGEDGVWKKDVLEGLKWDTSSGGPPIDLRKEIFRYLGPRVSVLTDYQLPMTTSSERLLIAIEMNNEKELIKGVAKFFKGNTKVRRREIAGHIVWESVDAQRPAAKRSSPDLREGPSVAPARRRGKKNADDEDDQEDKEPQLLTHRAITVANGQLMIASHIGFLEKVLAPEKTPEPLLDDAEYRRVGAEIAKLDPQRSLRFFSRTDEEYRPTYELTRINKMPESESLFAKLLNGVLGDPKSDSPRKQKVDGREMPDYQSVRHYLGPAGLQVTSEPEGWFLKGFTLTK